MHGTYVHSRKKARHSNILGVPGILKLAYCEEVGLGAGVSIIIATTGTARPAVDADIEDALDPAPDPLGAKGDKSVKSTAWICAGA